MTDLVITLAVIVVSFWIVLLVVRRAPEEERPLVLLSFGCHQLAAAVSILITQYYYGYGDLLSYHRFGVVAADRLRADFWTVAPPLVQLIFHEPVLVPVPIQTLGGSSASMQGISAFMMLPFADSLFGACAFIATLAFFAKFALLKVVRAECPHLPHRPLILATMLLPSAVFWSACLLKEPLAMIGLLGSIYGWHNFINQRKRVRAIFLIVCGSAVVILVKGYAFPAFALALAAWHVVREMRRRRGDVFVSVSHAIIGGIGALIAIFITGAVLPQFAPDVLTERLADMQIVGQQVEGGSNYSLGASAGSATSQVALAPLGLLTALFRPTLLEARSAPVVLSAIETAFFISFTLIVVVRRGIPASLSALLKVPFLTFCAVFVVVFGTCVGLGTTNMGTLVRYRMPLTPFFATLLFALMKQQKGEKSAARFPVAREALS